MNGPGATIRPPPGCCANAVIAASISASSCTGVSESSAASDGGAAPNSRRKNGNHGAVGGLNTKVMRLTPGAISLSNSSHFPIMGDEREAGDVPTRTRQAGDEVLSDWIVDHRENDRDGVDRLFQCCSDRATSGDNEVRCRTYHFRRISLDSGEIPVGKPMLDLNVTPPGANGTMMRTGGVG